MYHRFGAAEDPMVGVRALDAHARLVGRHHGGAAQGRQGRLTPGLKARLGPEQHLGQAALADAQAEQVEESLLQTLVGQSLKGLQVQGRGMQARAEGCRSSSGRPRRGHPSPAPRAHHGEAPVLLDEGLYLRQLDVLVHADRFGRQIRRQRQTAVWACRRAMVDNRVGIFGDDAAMAFMAGLGASRAGLLTPLFAVRRWRLGRRARRLGRALQLQHQLDQFILAQALEITAAHATKESAFNEPRKPSLHIDPLQTAPAASSHPVGRYV